MDNNGYVRGLEDGIEIVQDAVSRLLEKKLPIAEFRSQLVLEVEHFHRKARGKKLESIIQELES